MEKRPPHIVEVLDNGLGFDLDLEDGPANPYLELYSSFSMVWCESSWR